VPGSSSTTPRSRPVGTPDSDFFLDDVAVSREHAVFAQEADGYAVRDVGSVNGTHGDRELVDHHLLRAGNEVQIGMFRLVYYAGGGMM
jgi:pSer/pThr/pTyr-binding forkhead associated (FHA) protein